MRPKHTISVKIALYKQDGSAVLIMKYPKIYGLPGGHLEKKEMPDEAIVRELKEELGISLEKFSRTDFFLRGERGSSIILGYTAILPKNIRLLPPRPDKEKGVWMSKHQVEGMNDSADIASEYVRLILENWPK